MNVLDRWQRRLGIRTEEGQLVGLFFLHNFLLGIGTVLVYVAATAFLLENNPERNLPLAYAAAALAMMGAGRVYGYYEHRLPLPSLAGHVLLAVVALTGGLGVLVATGQSVGAAVALVAGYRVVYLLTNLEFWGVSAVVFDVRQGRRLFSIISAGDLPAKALGAVLGILVHRHLALLGLLGLAFTAFGGAWRTLQATGRRHRVEARSAPRAARAQPVRPRLQRWFGNSRLVLALCLSLAAVAAVTTGVEYAFFVHVKHRFHDQAAVMRYVGSVLVVTYLAALGFKLLLSRVALDRVGIRWMLVALPLGGLTGLLGFGALQWAGAGDTARLVYFCGLYLLLEVLRRAVFDPVFLVLFQPLPASERLQAHTLVKGFYEPLGMALAGGLLWAGQSGPPALGRWVPFAWMALFMSGALYLLHRAYGHYLAELQHALGQRFAAAGPQSSVPGPGPRAAGAADETAAWPAKPTAELIDLLAKNTWRDRAADALVQRGETALAELTAVLHSASGASEGLVRRVAQVCGRLAAPAAHQALVELTRQPHRARRAAALRALRPGPRIAGEAPGFQALVEEELALARALLHGQAASADGALQRALTYELELAQGRLFGLLRLLYPPALVAAAQRSVAHAARERQANALEMLDNLIPRAWYRALQALLEPAAYPDRARAFDALWPHAPAPPPLLPRIVREGTATFTDWTLALALRSWHPAPDEWTALLPHLRSPSALVRAGADAALAGAAHRQPGPYQHFVLTHHLAALLMSHHTPTGHIPDLERVQVLQRTALFAATPDNVLSSIVPIMRETTFAAGQQVFAKGDPGASMFIVYAGEVDIFNGPQVLATFGPGDFFGELALLDAEPRSATAVARSPVVAFRLNQDDFFDVMEERGEVLRNVLRVLCQRLRRQNEASAAAPAALAGPAVPAQAITS